MIVLGIESSCDETAAAIVNDKKEILGQCLLTQLDEHKPFGGVVPEIAARRIERHAKVVRVFAANDLVDVADEAENSRGVDAVGVPHRTTNECVIESEYQRVSVDQE